jgi:hypothetical protein
MGSIQPGSGTPECNGAGDHDAFRPADRLLMQERPLGAKSLM